MKIVAVVVTFNRKEKLKKVLTQFKKQTKIPSKIILIDNCSTDGTEEMLTENGFLDDELIQYHKLSKNIGGAGGFKKGIEVAMEEGFDWLSLSDDDAMPENDFYEQIINASKLYPNVKCFTGVVKFMDGEIQLSHRRRVTDWNVLKEQIITKDEYVSDFNLDILSFVGCVINQEVIKKIGLPRDDFFIWYDDIEYSLRIRKETKIKNIAKAVILHNTKNLKPNEKEHKAVIDWREYYGLRNSIRVRLIYSQNKLMALFKTIFGFLKRLVKLSQKKYSGKRLYFLKLYLRSYNDGIFEKMGKNVKYLP